MAVSPDTLEVTDFKMKQLCRLKITNDLYDISENCSLLATSNLYGVIFVGTPNSVLVIKVAEIVNSDLKTASKKTEITDYVHKKITLPSKPCFLALSSDSLTLVVCVQKSGCPVGLLYDVRGLARKEADWNPFQEVRLSATEGVTVCDCAWNPAVSELLAVSLSDGSLLIVEVKDKEFSLNSLPPSTGAEVISWSPKGKQLAVVRPGLITQYKPDLKEAKSIKISGTDLNMQKPQACSIQWLSTLQFLVSFVDQNDESPRPHLVIVNTFKTGPTQFVDYDDVCYGNLSIERPFRYFTAGIVPWNFILASSATAMDIAVLGQTSTQDAEHPEWRQLILEDEFRAELPLTANNDETRPLGLAIDTTSQALIPWSDNQNLSAMPILFILSSSGQLCSFHLINLRKEAAPFNQPPQEVSSENERRGESRSKAETIKGIQNPLAASTPLSTQNRMMPFSSITGVPLTSSTDARLPIPTDTKPKDTLKQGPEPVQPPPSFSIPSSLPKLQPAASLLGSQGSFFSAPQPQPAQPIAKPATLASSAVTPSAINQIAPTAKQTTTLQADREDTSLGAAKDVLNEEIVKFIQEMKEFKIRSGSVKTDIGKEQDKQNLLTLTAEMESFQKELVETTKTQDEEIRSLCSELVDLAALLEDTRLRHARRKNPKFNHLLKLRPLDPLNRRKMDTIEGLHMHIEQQLEEASRILDSISCGKVKEHQRKLEIPITQVIYEALKNNAKVISQLKVRVERIKEQSKEQQLKLAGAALEALREKSDEARKWDSELASLADSLLISKTADKIGSSFKPVIPQVSPEKQAMLRSVLAQRPVARIRPARPESASESRLLSNLSILLQHEEKKELNASSIESSQSGITSTVKTVSSREAHDRADTTSSVLPQVPTLSASSTVSTAKQIVTGIEDITPPSTPFNLDQKARALSGKTLFSSLSFQSQPGGTSNMNQETSKGLTQSTLHGTSTKDTALGPSTSFGSVQNFGTSFSLPQNTTPTKPASTPAFTSSPAVSFASSIQTAPTVPQTMSAVSSQTGPSIKETNLASSAFGVPSSAKAGSSSVGISNSALPSTGPSSTPAPSSIFTLKSQPPPPAVTSASISSSSLTKTSSFANLASSLSSTSNSLSHPTPDLAASSSTPSSTPASTPASSVGSITSTSSVTSVAPTNITTSVNSSLVTTPTTGFTAAKGSQGSSETAPSKISSFSFSLEGSKPITSSSSSTLSSFSFSLSGDNKKPAVPSPSLFGAVSTASTTTTPSFLSLKPTEKPPTVFGVIATATTTATTSSTTIATTTTATTGSTATTVTPTALISSSSGGSIFGTQSSTLANQTPSATSVIGSTPASGSFKFGQPTSAASSTSSTIAPLFGSASSTATTTAGSFLGTTKPNTLGASSSGSFFGTSIPTTTSTISRSLFGTSTPSTTTAGSLFGNTSTALIGGGSSLFGKTTSTQPDNTPATSSGALTSLFGQSKPSEQSGLATTTSQTTSFFGTPTTSVTDTSSSSGGLFGRPVVAGEKPESSSVFGKPAASSSTFGNAFGQGLFGQPAMSSAGTGSVFGQSFTKPAPSTPSGGTNVFGGQPQSSIFGQSASVFGQSATANAHTTTEQNNKPLFGASSFGTPSSTSPSASSNTGFGSGLFGSMGLGSTPSAADAQKNVFGGGTVFGNSSSNNTSLFGTNSSAAFGSPSSPTTAAPSFSSPTSSQFGAFGQSKPAFGGAPTFGGSPLFGSKPTFGGGATFGSPVSSSAPPKPEGFGAFAASSSVPSFGGLASSGSSFEALAHSGNSQPAFGGAAFPQNNAPSFGGGSSFSSWR